MIETLLPALTLQLGYNATLVALGSALLGASAGACGVFLLLRRRALLSDALAHATLPGLALAFLVMTALGGEGRNLAGLLAGAALSAALGLILIEWITSRTRLREDAAIGAILAVFFGIGIVLLTVIQGLPSGKQAGLQGYLVGSTAGMLLAEAVLVAAGSLVALIAILLLRRPMTILAFDPGFAAAIGMNTQRLDLLATALATAIMLIGLKIVGIVLVVALLIIPAAAARFWSGSAGRMLWVAALIGALSAYLGAAISAVAPKVPTGPAIVLAAFVIFLISLAIAPHRGVLPGLFRQRRSSRPAGRGAA